MKITTKLLFLFVFFSQILSGNITNNPSEIFNGLVAYFPFNGNVTDHSDFANQCYVSGATLAEDRFGQPKSAFYFDGINDSMIIAHSELLNFNSNEQDYSVSLWVKSGNVSGGYGRLFSKWNDYIITPYPCSFQVDPTRCSVNLYDGTEARSIYFDNIWDNDWHHLVMTVNSQKNIFYGYLDGILIDSLDITNLSSTGNNSDIHIGYNPYRDYHFQGYIDDIRIFNREIRGQEVKSLFNRTGLFADFKADSTVGIVPFTTQFIDLSISDSLSSILGWAWDFDDDGIIDSNEPNPEWTYNQPGSFSVTLSVIDSFTMSSKIKENYILALPGIPEPVILSIEDVPKDQGGWVIVKFIGSKFDTDTLKTTKTSSAESYTIEIKYDSLWTAANSLTAYGEPIYSVLVHTPFDSTKDSDGLLEFRIIAGMNEGNYVSDIKTGYSVDNLVPNIPQDVKIKLDEPDQVILSWDKPNDTDFRHFNIYKNLNGIFNSLSTYYSQSVNNIFVDNQIGENEIYYYTITSEDFSGNESGFSEIVTITISSIQDQLDQIPKSYFINQNYPNPFNPETKIVYGLPKSSMVKLIIYDITGSEVIKLVDQYQAAGTYSIDWNGVDNNKKKISTGVYIYKIEAGNFSRVKKMILTK
jgi:PKD repeat protein